MTNSEIEHDDLTAMVRGMKSVASPFRAFLTELQRRLAPVDTGTLSPNLSESWRADPQWLGICVADTSGRVYEVGDSLQTFPILNLANPFVYGLALGEHGREAVLTRVGVTPGNDSVTIGEDGLSIPPNPLVAMGAIELLSLVKGQTVTERLNSILSLFRRLCNREMTVDASIFTALRMAGHRYRALAHALSGSGLLGEDVDETLDLFFQQQSLMVSAHDLAVMAATLANQGKNPVSGEVVLEPGDVRDMLSVMFSCGMRNTAGAWAYEIGLPAESSTSGAIIAVVPGKLGIAVFSPPLDERGHSVRGQQVCVALAERFGLHLFEPQERRARLEEALNAGRGAPTRKG